MLPPRRLALAWLPLVLIAAAAAQPTADLDPVRIRADLDRVLAAADFDSALGLADQLVAHQHAEYLDALTTVVRIHCRRGDRTAAYLALQELLDAGCWDFRALAQDTTLALVNREDRFRGMVRKAWSAQYIEMLERDSRDAMQHPDEIMAALAFRPGERVADVGAGSGYFTLRVARAVGETGKVWALDIRQEMLDFIAGRLASEDLRNVELGLVTPDDPGLPVGGVDTILMVDVFHYIQERTAYAEKLRRALAPGGRLVVIDFRYDPEAEREFAPPVEQQVRREDLDRALAAAGLRVVASYDFLPEQYFVIYVADPDRADGRP